MTKLLLLLLGGAKFGKLLTTGGTMLISLQVYGWMFGWRYAAGFIPFVGAWIEMKQMPHNAETEAL